MKKVWLGAGAAAVAALIAIVVILPGESTATGAVRLRVLKETVSMRAVGDSTFTKATSGSVVAPKTDFRTDATGLGQFDFWDGSLTRIGPSTEYTLSVLSRNGGQRAVEGKLDIGKTWHNVKKVTTSGSRFEVRTANAVAAVRGTTFAVVCLVRNVCTVSVISGSVLVTGKNGDVVLVGAGQEVTVDELGQLSPLRPIDPDNDWLNQNIELDQLQAEVTPGGGDDSGTSTTVLNVDGNATVDSGPNVSVGGGATGPGGSPDVTVGAEGPRGGGDTTTTTPGETTTTTPGETTTTTQPTTTTTAPTTTTTRDGYPPRPPGP